MSFVFIVAYIIELYVFIHLVTPFLLFLITKIKRARRIHANENATEADFGIIITAYEQTGLLQSVVSSILNLDYKNYLIYIVADNCDISTLNFADSRVVLLRPETVLASNTKSHFYAIERFKRAHDKLTIIDSDNLVRKDYLTELNKTFSQGFRAVQGVREAKNLNSNYACLDAAGDIYYRYIDRELLFNAGSSASLSGSGMAFDTQLYKDCMESLQFTGAGFDKILQYEILKRKLRIAFTDGAVVYDEKTAKSDQLVKQRARWINTWFKFLKLGISLFVKSVVNLNWNQFLFSITLMRPPLFILIILSAISFVFHLFFNPWISVAWVTGALCFIYIFYYSLSYFKADPRIFKSLSSIPKFFFYQVLALTKVFKANKLSVATKHDQDLSIEELKEQK
jgi:cellulose synthase/poly-beta-1,6-N-acetylglucosamine synthase-like glycosyltransferase